MVGVGVGGLGSVVLALAYVRDGGSEDGVSSAGPDLCERGWPNVRVASLEVGHGGICTSGV